MELDRILRCPRCRASLTTGPRGYDCRACRVTYLVNEGIANFTPADAIPLPDEQPPDKDPSDAR